MTSTQSLKIELFSSLSKQGFHDDIKKQVRMKLVEQLKDNKALEIKTQTKQLFKRVLSSLIMEELENCNQSLTESVYSIESGFEGAHMTRNELIQLLTFNQQSINPEESVLEYILRKNQPFSSSTLQNQEIQTNAQEMGYTLEQKLMMVDQEYRMNLLQKQNINKTNSLDRKRLEFELEQKLKKQMDLFKEFQTHKIKIKVGEEWRMKFESYSNEIAEEYRRKYDLLRKRDKQLREEYVEKHKNINVKINESQKMIQQKIQLLNMKSVTVSTQMQNLQRAKKDFQQLMTKREKQLQDKIKEYDNLSLTLKEKIKYEVNLAKLSLQQEFQDREAQSMRRKKVIDEDYGKLMGIKDSIEIVEWENKRLGEENGQLRSHLVMVEKQLKDTVMELGSKVNRIQVLKDDLSQMTDNKNHLQEKIKQQLKRSKRYEGEIIAMREQLEKLRAKENVNRSNISVMECLEVSVREERSGETRKIEEVNRRMEKLKNERKRDIEKFKMDI